MTETFEINICDFIQSLYLAMYFICYCQCPLRHSSRHRSNSTTYFRKKSICKISFHINAWPMCWEIVSNSNCDLKSQLGFPIKEEKINLGFLSVEGKTIP